MKAVRCIVYFNMLHIYLCISFLGGVCANKPILLSFCHNILYLLDVMLNLLTKMKQLFFKYG